MTLQKVKTHYDKCPSDHRIEQQRAQLISMHQYMSLPSDETGKNIQNNR